MYQVIVAAFVLFCFSIETIKANPQFLRTEEKSKETRRRQSKQELLFGIGVLPTIALSVISITGVSAIVLKIEQRRAKHASQVDETDQLAEDEEERQEDLGIQAEEEENKPMQEPKTEFEFDEDQGEQPMEDTNHHLSEEEEKYQELRAKHQQTLVALKVLEIEISTEQTALELMEKRVEMDNEFVQKMETILTDLQTMYGKVKSGELTMERFQDYANTRYSREKVLEIRDQIYEK